MRQKEYNFNPETLTYEPVERPRRLRRYLAARRFLLFFLTASVVNLVYSLTYYTPKLHNLEEQGLAAAQRLTSLSRRIESTGAKIEELHHRDKHIYRALFGSDTLSIKGVYTPYSPTVYADCSNAYGGVALRAWKMLDQHTRLLYLESRSLDQLQLLSKDKELMAASIPAIWPINKRDLRGHIGAFGTRLHPIYNRYIEHKGLDFGARTGDPVYATGNGEITISEQGEAKRSYGQQIVIDHGFGYKTRYAHLSRRLVTEGQYVKRGELIGYVGSSGGSTGPHLHYEVLYMGNNVDPINYFRRDMSVEELDEIIEQAKATTFETLE